MSFQNICAPAPVVSVVNNTVTALSTDVAKLFSKLHKDVLRSIRSLIEQAPSLNERNFALVEVKDAKGENRPAYRMDRKGFVLLAMGFTGEVALKFKIAYIDTFDRMEEQLRAQKQIGDTITNAQQVAIQQAVVRRAKKTAVYYQTIYRAIKARYQIPRYTELKQSQFEDCLRFIEVVDLSVPEAPTTTPPETERPQRYVVDADFLRTLQVFCYYHRYLFRKPMMQATRVMQALDVPDASKLWDAVDDLNLVKLERSLDDLGFSVKDLDCYKHWALTHAA
ncbi:Rha family transcriptional regulator [Parasutterella excrementihominis]|jgi:Rha family phage regulatory protein|uniref:Rha family transcriptional regulator n=2 Tax=Parasutterella excrementihominis TaxID=487175 RepID=UPI0035205E4D